MITSKSITKKQAQELYNLIEQETRAEIIARLGPTGGGINWYQIKLDKMDEIRRKLFGTDDQLALGIKWGILKKQPVKKKGAKKKREISKKERSTIHPLLLHKMEMHKEKNTRELLKQLKEIKDPKEKRKLRRELRRKGHRGGLTKGKETNKEQEKNGKKKGKKKKKKSVGRR